MQLNDNDDTDLSRENRQIYSKSIDIYNSIIFSEIEWNVKII